jgi:glycosyltransferase involved in cell wall biosynthesis
MSAKPRVLFISYTGMLEPLGRSQVIPYLHELASEGFEFTLLSFEREGAYSEAGRITCEKLKQELAGSNIEWHWLPYHKRVSLIATTYDVLAGIRYASRLVKTRRIDLIHARSQVAAAIAVALKKRFGLKMIFDIRGLMAEEYVDAGHWPAESVRYTLTKTMERRALAASDGVVTLTRRIWPLIREWDGLKGREVIHQVVPCCANLQEFRFNQEDRDRRRAELNLSNRLVLVYSGTIGSWYWTAEMIDFFAELLKTRSDAHFLWLTNGDEGYIHDLMQRRHITRSSYSIIAAPSADVASYLSAADLGIAFYKPGFSRFATSPVKVTEYFACGLPVIINSGIGDLDELIEHEQIGSVVKELMPQEFAKAISECQSLLEDQAGTRQTVRSVAEKYFDVREVGRTGYAQLYNSVLGYQEPMSVYCHAEK